jgi:hypothetical protein
VQAAREVAVGERALRAHFTKEPQSVRVRIYRLSVRRGCGSEAGGTGSCWVAFTGALHHHRLEQLVSSIPGRKQGMASLVLKMSVSLDGYVAPIDGSTYWIAAGARMTPSVGLSRR